MTGIGEALPKSSTGADTSNGLLKTPAQSSDLPGGEKDFEDRLLALGFSDKNIKESLKNKKIATSLRSIVNSSLDTKLEAPKPSLLCYLAKLDNPPIPHRNYIVKSIKSGDLKTNVQVDAAAKHCRTVEDDDLDKEAFNIASGVGITVEPEEIVEKVKQYIDKHKVNITADRYKALPATITHLKNEGNLKWASPLDVKNATEAAFLELLGPKDERDKKGKPSTTVSTSKTHAPAVDGSTSSAAVAIDNPLDNTAIFREGWLADLHKTTDDRQTRPELHQKHLAATGGQVVTRFPPEPNGYLHIGHSKAIAINFGFARYHGGICYLRFDDTNPAAEKAQFFDSIEEIVEWLGFKPHRVTYSSDNFAELYKLAEKLIMVGKAYVCFCSRSEAQALRGGGRGKPRPCEHRERPREESLQLFRDMRDGKFKEGEVTLRMKQDLESGNPQMWDLTAYRVKDDPHHRTKKEWCIYPTYDFTHCLCDSIENITHSLCTTEFSTSRVSYDWLCEAVDVYRPQQNEYARLNMNGTLMSKRKIADLVEKGKAGIRGWDDPRLSTLVGVRRRGVPPGAILSFVSSIGVTESNTVLEAHRFDVSVRAYLEETVPRLMLILDPIRVILENLPDDHCEEFSVDFKPNDPKMGNHIVPFTKVIYIDRSDFREEDSKDYKRLAPGKPVGLFKVPSTIRVTTFSKDKDTGLVTEIRAHYENDAPFKKPKAYIQWVAESSKHDSPVRVEARVFHPLYVPNPDYVKGESNKEMMVKKVGKAKNQATPEVIENLREGKIEEDVEEGNLLLDEEVTPKAGEEIDKMTVNEHSRDIFDNAIVEIGIFEVRRRAPWPELEGEKKETKEDGMEKANGEEIGSDGQSTNKDNTTSDKKVAKDTFRPETVRFQALRVGYFAMDSDSTDDKIVLNRIVGLKDTTKETNTMSKEVPAASSGRAKEGDASGGITTEVEKSTKDKLDPILNDDDTLTGDNDVNEPPSTLDTADKALA